MNEYEKLVPAEMREMVAVMIDKAREHLARDDRIAPVALVGSIGGDATILGGLGNMSKNAAAALMRKTAKTLEADFILHIDECWMANSKGKTREEVERLYQKYGEVRLMPDRIDAVMFNLETRVGMFAAYPEREGVEGAYTFGDVKMELIPEMSGRFVGLLPPLRKGH